MKKIYRVSALLLALLMCVMTLPVCAAADATVSVGNVTAKAGETVEVPVSITHLENIASIGLHVWYDPAVLKCVSAKMSDTVGAMDMANANIKPVRHQNTVILTAISLKPVVLDGVVMTITFEVLADAPDGTAAVKVTEEGLSVSTTELVQLSVDRVDGSVTVGDAVASTPSANVTTAVTTTTQKKSTEASATTVKNDVTPTTTTKTTVSGATQETPAPEADAATTTTGVSIELPEETVVDTVGNIVTDANGEPTKVKAIGVFVGLATAKPNDTVAIRVSLSSVAELTALGLSVHYDVTALSFEGGECLGFVKNGSSMNSVLEHKSGIVDISAIAANGLSGSGEIAELRFKVKNTAKNGEYRLAIKGDPLLQSKTFEFPVKTVAGEIRVEGASQSKQSGLYIALGVVAAAAASALVVWLCLRRKKNAPVKDVTPKAPATINVSGEDDE